MVSCDGRPIDVAPQSAPNTLYGTHFEPERCPLAIRSHQVIDMFDVRNRDLDRSLNVSLDTAS
ncbi:protein of unknown function [Methylocaldum szegediense]|uniref:Uncharacterized protein n=1 Tax=Methylocaldum szegediense TaxID=73780 RepID=A0ABM9I6M8_9GAMM|nr:protein of unknown function [Methylocaldum szegediense]